MSESQKLQKSIEEKEKAEQNIRGIWKELQSVHGEQQDATASLHFGGHLTQFDIEKLIFHL